MTPKYQHSVGTTSRVRIDTRLQLYYDWSLTILCMLTTVCDIISLYFLR